jgi:hypothetical protein
MRDWYSIGLLEKARGENIVSLIFERAALDRLDGLGETAVLCA